MREYYYQIDFIDEEGLANYIQSYNFSGETENRQRQLKQQMLYEYNVIKDAFTCIHDPLKTKVVLDLYRYDTDIVDSDEWVCNIKI